MADSRFQFTTTGETLKIRSSQRQLDLRMDKCFTEGRCVTRMLFAKERWQRSQLEGDLLHLSCKYLSNELQSAINQDAIRLNPAL